MNKKVFSLFGIGPDDPKWSDWKWQYGNRITDIEKLAGIVSLNEKQRQDIAFCLKSFRMAITPYYASLMDPEDASCPIRMQAIPSVLETRRLPCEMADPLREDSYSPVKGIVHRYPDRVLFLVTLKCAMYCRHCTRRRLVGEEDCAMSKAEMEEAIGYIARTQAVRDVLISGGDPLTLSDGALEDIISRLRKIEHVETIRIGTRVPVTLPMRITPGLLSMLKKYQPIWINTHFNHPKELTAQAAAACGAIVDAGIPMGNQSVLLRNINDNTETMKELLLKLIRARVRPYYLYQCDLSEGIGHFRTDVDAGIRIIDDLTGNISGYAIPRFVIDAPGGGGKIPINPEYIISKDGGQVVMRNFEGKTFAYPQPEDY